MILVRLAGGLGNQIFQLSATLLLAKKVGLNKIHIDLSGLNNYEAKHKNELVYFFNFKNIEINYVRNKVINFRIPKIFPFKLPFYPFVSDNNFQVLLKNPNKQLMILDGYFQDCLTQEDFDIEIKMLKDILLPSKYDEDNEYCIIHIRGGDFVKLGWNIISPKEYYINAIKIMKEEYNKNKFKVVTDDKNYASIVLDELDINYEFIGNSIYDDFYLIGRYKYRIISSSTFSMWASALSNNENSVVISPKYWTPNNPRKILLPNEKRITF
ncbi:alpha-1,2-fucosyltransferase [Aliarcobacter butzleri]|uniref:alpha-1,2-fucosyltransferase n=1 Tax=Aliarcobacter butzleri TaxID=28197 RepID=UPI0021B2679C|nr:alpha-1,2-fucosyltransferase [Aliarcobacter butzleri]MCT7568954.1 alpha-1,2-fucosyltransferase [Aliarcobacter butzleri]